MYTVCAVCASEGTGGREDSNLKIMLDIQHPETYVTSRFAYTLSIGSQPDIRSGMVTF